jgi:molybdopterin-containing oxidoreductase family membrane subunit
MPLIYVSIVWALSIHTVTAFLFNTMPARPFWHQSVMPLQFIATAFAAGPALIILMFLIIRKNTKLLIADEAINMLSTIATFCLGIALFVLMSEVVTELYAPTEHSMGIEYLMFGVDGMSPLVPLFWAALTANVVAFVMLLIPRVRKNYHLLPVACVLMFAGIWVQKGVGLLVPGYIPSPIGELTNYVPTALELLVTLGNWAIGFFILTILAKGAIGVLLGDVKYRSDSWGLSRDEASPYRASFEPTTTRPWAPFRDRSAEVGVGGGQSKLRKPRAPSEPQRVQLVAGGRQ